MFRKGVEYHLPVLAMAAFLLIRGAGAFSFDLAATIASAAEPSRATHS